MARGARWTRSERDVLRGSVVGEFDLEWASDVDVGGAIARASNRVRASIRHAASHLPADDGALFRGLVVGDDPA